MATSSMDLPTTDMEVIPEKIEDVKDGGPMLYCDLFNVEVVHKIAQEFLPGLGSACVDNTVGGLFKSPATVAVDMRKEMVDYLTQRSENFVAESVILENDPNAEVSDHPYDIITGFIDDFASSKRNFFSRVSGWLLSERREDRIDDFVQEMEVNGFWLLERREVIAQNVLKNVDFKNTYHCNEKFNTEEELNDHALQCGFMTMNCTHEGCNARFCAFHLENHDSICPFRIIPCEQKCGDFLMRREMDRHCITVCPMKLTNCPFYPVGCQLSVPQLLIEQHRQENLHSHVVHILQNIHKEASLEDLEERAEELELASSPGQLAAARDVRSLTFAIKNLEAKLGPMKVNTKKNIDEEHVESPTNDNNQHSESPTKEDSNQSTTKELELKPLEEEENCTESPSKKEDFTESSPTDKEDDNEGTTESPSKKKEFPESPTKNEDNNEGITESPSKKEEFPDSPTKSEDDNKGITESPSKKEEFPDSPTKSEDGDEGITESPSKKAEFPKSPMEKEDFDEGTAESESPSKKEEFPKSPREKEDRDDSSPEREGFNK